MSPGAAGDAEGSSDPRTRRELAVLQFLPTNFSAAEIAGELFLSVHTVSAHIRHIYAKLGVHRRRDAVRRARTLRLRAPSPSGAEPRKSHGCCNARPAGPRDDRWSPQDQRTAKEMSAMTGQEHTLAGGELNHAIANAVVRGHRRYVGRGPVRAQAFHRHNIIVVVMYDALTQAEQSLVADGREEAVLDVRYQLQQLMQAPLVRAVEELTGCEVEASMSTTHIKPDLTAQLFVLDRWVPTEQAASVGTSE